MILILILILFICFISALCITGFFIVEFIVDRQIKMGRNFWRKKAKSIELHKNYIDSFGTIVYTESFKKTSYCDGFVLRRLDGYSYFYHLDDYNLIYRPLCELDYTKHWPQIIGK